MGYIYTSEGSANLSSACRYVNIDNATVGSFRSGPSEQVAHVFGEEAAGQALVHLVVPFDRLVDILIEYKCMQNIILEYACNILYAVHTLHLSM